LKIIKIISEHKRIRSFKFVAVQTKLSYEPVKVDVRPPRRGYKRVEAIVKDNWNQLWTRHIDVKKDIIITSTGTTY